MQFVEPTTMVILYFYTTIPRYVQYVRLFRYEGLTIEKSAR